MTPVNRLDAIISNMTLKLVFVLSCKMYKNRHPDPFIHSLNLHSHNLNPKHLELPTYSPCFVDS